MRALVARDLLRRAGGDDLAAVVDHPEDGLDRVRVLLADHDRVAALDPFAAQAAQLVDVVDGSQTAGEAQD